MKLTEAQRIKAKIMDKLSASVDDMLEQLMYNEKVSSADSNKEVDFQLESFSADMKITHHKEDDLVGLIIAMPFINLTYLFRE